jgi:SAM-dependent methyltransferase
MNRMIEELIPYLRCPETGSSLTFQGDRLVSKKGLGYAFNDGIAELVARPESGHKQPVDNYAGLPTWVYDAWVNNRVLMKVIWGIDLGPVKEKVIHHAPESPGGILLDVPCGTGAIHGLRIYRKSPETRFIAIDYSMPMLRKARDRCRRSGVENVFFIRADVCCLPLASGVLSGGLTLNGLHAFAEPGHGLREMARCMAHGSQLLVTTVCNGTRFISSFAMDHIMIPRGVFLHSISPSGYLQMLTTAGFQCEQTWQRGALLVALARKE